LKLKILRIKQKNERHQAVFQEKRAEEKYTMTHQNIASFKSTKKNPHVTHTSI